MISTVSFTVGAAGVLTVEWDTVTPFFFSFFGVVNPPGASMTAVPEPASGLLLALGVVGLATLRRYGLTT